MEAPERALRDGRGRESGGTAHSARATAAELGERGERAIVCTHCGHVITAESARIARDGSHEHEFVNPEGQSFQILCFASAPGALGAGPASEIWTWFPGFAWRALVCAGCLVHVGWSFSRGEQSFFGLIRERIGSS